MQLDFDLDHVAMAEFGVGRKQPAMFYFVPVDAKVKVALQGMVRKTVELMGEDEGPIPYYQPSEKYGSTESCYLDSDDPMAKLFCEVSSAVNRPPDPQFPKDLANVTCYFVQLTDRSGRQATAFRRAVYFKGLAKRPLLHWARGTLELVDDRVFKLDTYFDLIVDSKRVHILRPKSFELLGGLKEQILKAVPDNVSMLAAELPYVDFDSVESYAEERIRAAGYVSSIRQHNLKGMDMASLEDLCRTTGVNVKRVNGRLTVPDEDVMGFLEVLDRRRYGVELVRNSPEYYRATSRQKVVGP